MILTDNLLCRILLCLHMHKQARERILAIWELLKIELKENTLGLLHVHKFSSILNMNSNSKGHWVEQMALFLGCFDIKIDLKFVSKLTQIYRWLSR